MAASAPSTPSIERFRALIAALDIDHQAWGDAFWLRFAAQAAVLVAEPPEQVARRIQDAAGVLREQSPWYGALASPVRFVIAALLVQAGVRPQAFLGQHQRITALFRAAGIRPGGAHETMAIVVLRLAAKGRRHVGERQVMRVKALYDQIKHLHWWLTGPDDLPACAALAHVTGTPGDIAARVEDCYQRLAEAGLDRGDPLQTTACLLPLSGDEPPTAVARLLALARQLTGGGRLPAEQYESLAVLALAEHDAVTTVARLRAIDDELRLAQPDLLPGVRFKIAADLAALDLIRLDLDLAPIRDLAGLRRVRTRLHTVMVATSVLISQAEIDREVLESAIAANVWP